MRRPFICSYQLQVPYVNNNYSLIKSDFLFYATIQYTTILGNSNICTLKYLTILLKILSMNKKQLIKKDMEEQQGKWTDIFASR